MDLCEADTLPEDRVDTVRAVLDLLIEGCCNGNMGLALTPSARFGLHVVLNACADTLPRQDSHSTT